MLYLMLWLVLRWVEYRLVRCEAAPFGGWLEEEILMSSLFDEIARVLAKPVPRRKTLKTIGGSLLGAFMATVGAQRAMALTQDCNVAKPCSANSECQSGNCKSGLCCPNSTDVRCNNSCCSAGACA